MYELALNKYSRQQNQFYLSSRANQIKSKYRRRRYRGSRRAAADGTYIYIKPPCLIPFHSTNCTVSKKVYSLK